MALADIDNLTVDDILDWTPARQLAALGHPGHSDQSARAVLAEVVHFACLGWDITPTDVLNDSALYRHAVANDR